MKNSSRDEKHKSLVEQLEKRLFFTLSLLLLALIIRFGVGILENADQYNLGERKLALRQDIDGILRTMLDQETSLRGYVATTDPTFLEPFNSSRPEYLSYLQQMKNLTKISYFSNTAAQVANVEERANDWYTNFAQVQIKNM